MSVAFEVESEQWESHMQILDDTEDVAKQLAQRNILIKPLNDPALGRGYLRVTTALPDDNQRFVAALAEVLGRGQDRPI